MLSWTYAKTVWPLADANNAHHCVEHAHGVGILASDVNLASSAGCAPADT